MLLRNLKARVGLEPTISDFRSRQIKPLHQGRRPLYTRDVSLNAKSDLYCYFLYCPQVEHNITVLPWYCMVDVSLVNHADNEVEIFYIKSCNTCTYSMYLSRRNNSITIDSLIRIYWRFAPWIFTSMNLSVSFFLLDIIL